MRRVPVLLAALAALVDVRSGDPTVPVPSSRPIVAVLGDSIAHAATPFVLAELHADHVVHIEAWPGEGFAGGAWSRRHGSAWWLLDRARDVAWIHADVVVVELGTNDVWPRTALPLDEVHRRLLELVDVFPDACVAVVLLRADVAAPDYDNVAAAQVNEWLAAVADVTIAPTWSTHDGVHPTNPGSVLDVGAAIATGVRACT